MTTTQSTTPTTATPAPAQAQPAGTQAPVAASPTSSVTTETVNPGSWKAGFGDELKGYLDQKGFKSPQDLAESYRNFEKLQGVPQDRIVKLSDKMFDEWGSLTAEGRSVFERMGAPKEAKDYNLPLAEGGDKNFLESMRNTFYKLGIPKNAAEKLVAKTNEYQAAMKKQMTEQANARFQQDNNTLKTDWGAAFDQNTRIAQEAVRTMGVTKEQIDAISNALGHAATMKMFKDFGTKVAEAPFVGGRPVPQALEPATARAEIATLRGDRNFGERLLRGDVDAKAKWEILHRQAYPGDRTI